jgi:hypothetical protein
MSLGHPITAAGPRDPDRPRSIPAPIRKMITLMVRGDPSNPDQALDFIQAAKVANVAPDRARRWLDTSEVRALLRTERRRYRDEICSFNEGALRRIRDNSPNAMAQLGSIRVLEAIAEEAEARPRGERQVGPGLVIVLSAPHSPSVPPPTDVTPVYEADKPIAEE